MNTRNNDDDDRSSLSTPPLPITSEQTQFIKAEPMSPSASAAPLQRHMPSGQRHSQGQGRGQSGSTVAMTVCGRCECQGQAREDEAGPVSCESQSQGQGRGHCLSQDQCQGQAESQDQCQCQRQGQGRNGEAATLAGQGYIPNQTPVEDRESGSAAVLTSLLGDNATSTSPLSAFTAAAATTSSSSSSSVFDANLSTDPAVVPAKHARLELNPCATEWHPLD